LKSGSLILQESSRPVQSCIYILLYLALNMNHKSRRSNFFSLTNCSAVWTCRKMPPPHPEIPKAFQNRAKLNPIVKTVKYC